MVYVTRKCGRCGKMIDCMTPDNDEIKIGNPIEKCPNCGCVILKRKTKEIIMFNTLDYIMYFIAKIFKGLILSIIPGTIVMAITDNNILFFIVCIVIISLFMIKAIKRFNEDKLESIKRTKNIEYLDILLKTNCISKRQMEDFMDLYNIPSASKNTIDVGDNKNISNEFEINDMGSGMIQYAFKQVDEMEKIFKIHNVKFDYENYTLSTLSYCLGTFQAYAMNYLSAKQSNQLDKYFINKYTEINNNAYKNNEKIRVESLHTFKIHYEKAKEEATESIQQDGTFIDKGITDMYLVSFMSNEDIQKVKVNVVAHILSKWIVVYKEIFKEIKIKDK